MRNTSAGKAMEFLMDEHKSSPNMQGPQTAQTAQAVQSAQGSQAAQSVQAAQTSQASQVADASQVLTKKENAAQIIKFVLFSASAGIIQAAAFALMHELTALPYTPCYLTALTLSVLWNFTLNREFTFKSANNVPIAMLKVAAFYCVFTPLSTWCGNALTGIGWNEYAVLAVTMAANLTTEFLYDRFFVYRGSLNTNARAERAKQHAVSSAAQQDGSGEAQP